MAGRGIVASPKTKTDPKRHEVLSAAAHPGVVNVLLNVPQLEGTVSAVAWTFLVFLLSRVEASMLVI